MLLVDDDSVVHVAALDEVGSEQRLYVSYEHECSCFCNLLGEEFHVIECGKLAVDEFRVEGAHGGEAELIVGQDGDARARLLVFHFDFLSDDIPVFGSVLLLNAHLLYFVDILDGASVEDGKLGAVHLNETVVDAEGIECCQSVFHGRHSHFAFSQDGTSLGINHVFGNGVDDRHTFQVDTLNLVSGIFSSRVEGHGEAESGMQTLSAE